MQHDFNLPRKPKVLSVYQHPLGGENHAYKLQTKRLHLEPQENFIRLNLGESHEVEKNHVWNMPKLRKGNS